MGFYSKKLIARLKELGFDAPEGTRIRRCYPGHWQRAAGAYLWTFYHTNPQFWMWNNIGSCYTVRELAQCKKINICRHDHDVELIPEN